MHTYSIKLKKEWLQEWLQTKVKFVLSDFWQAHRKYDLSGLQFLMKWANIKDSHLRFSEVFRGYKKKTISGMK